MLVSKRVKRVYYFLIVIFYA